MVATRLKTLMTVWPAKRASMTQVSSYPSEERDEK
jgi:hypothetical protein